MRTRNFLLIAVAILSMVNGSLARDVPNVTKSVLLRSKEMKPYTTEVNVYKNGMDEAKFHRLIDSVLSADVVVDSDFDSLYKKYVGRKKVEKQRYEEYHLKIELYYNEEAEAFLSNQYLQEDVANFVAGANKYDDSLQTLMFGETKGAKNLDEVVAKLSQMKGYDAFVLGSDTAAFNAEINRYSDSKKKTFTRGVVILAAHGIVKAEVLRNWGDDNPMYELYDVESGKRIQVSDLLSSNRVKFGYSRDSVTLVKVNEIDKDRIRFYDDSTKQHIVDKDDSVYSVLTDYAKSLMARDKGYTISMTTNAYGDKMKKYHFTNVNGSPHDRDVFIPMELKGCSNTKKIRNRMLDIMFGQNNGDLDTLVIEGVKKWIPEYEDGKSMLLQPGDGLISFGFEDQSMWRNSKNIFVVFDRKTGTEISVNDLIKDKAGFMKFVNSHNLYLAGFLVDSTKIKEQSKKFGEQFRNYLRHSVAMGPFSGIKEFPTSWWFSFNKMDEIVPVEFNTPTARIFLDYADIKKYINPKYLKVMDSAVKSAGK